MKRLIEMQSGEKAKILDFFGQHGQGHKRGSLTRLASLGLRKGEIIEMLTNQRVGPILVRTGETRVAVGRGIAEKIAVNILPSEE